MKIGKVIKNNIFGIILGVILCTCVGVVATTTNTASEIRFATSKNPNVENVQDALDALYTASASMDNKEVIKCYNGSCGKLSYRYWNNNFAGTTGVNLFDSTHMPAITYASREELEMAYGANNFAVAPIYIRSVLINGNVVGHESCLWEASSEKEFCITLNYWGGEIGKAASIIGEDTKIKLQRDIQNSFGSDNPNFSCYYYYTDSYAGCSTEPFIIEAYSNGNVHCTSRTVGSCGIKAGGSAYCGNN